MRPLLPLGLPRFGARLGLAALASVGIWWLLREPFGAVFRTLGNLVVAGLGGSETVRFVPRQGAALFEPDSHLVYMASGKVLQMFDLPSSRFAYIPLAVLCSLAYAARQLKLRNLRRLLLGLAVMVGYIALGIGIVVLHLGLIVAPVAFRSVAALKVVVGLANTILTLPGFKFAIPAVIWYACTATLSVRSSADPIGRKASRGRT